MALIIKKRVDLSHLGEGFSEAFLEFKAIPITDLTAMQEKMPSKDDTDNAAQAIPVMLDVLKKYFIRGKAPDEAGELTDVSVEDLSNLDAETAVKCFQGLTGIDANLSQDSTTTSTP